MNAVTGSRTSTKATGLAALCLCLILLHRRGSEAEPPPAELPATRFWDESSGPRLRFRVAQRRAAASPPPPPAAANTSGGEFAAAAMAREGAASTAPLLPAVNDSATRCHLDGTESGGGCSGHACLLGACFCGPGAGGEWCERAAVPPSCAAEERQAYSPLSSGLHRHTAHDVCAFYNAPYGTLAVDRRRWKAAQEWEAALWTATSAAVTTDRNEHHRRQFDNYAELPRQLGHVVEVGCGPFTQLQTILPSRQYFDSITLVDPLIETYARKVRGCPYSRGKLQGKHVALVSAPLEELHLPTKADVLVMVSVLQSVRDVPRAMQAAYNALRGGGLLVFAERAFDERWEAYRASGKAEAAVFWDVGHPCAVKMNVLEHFMAAFRELYRKRHVHPTSRGPPDEQVYFIGRKPRRRRGQRWAALRRGGVNGSSCM